MTFNLIKTGGYQNVFSTLTCAGTASNVYDIWAPDVMHEFELGVWRTVFIHLIRILVAQEGGNECLVAEMDRRFEKMPVFGKETIRKFSSNTSALNKMAARDFEDILQVMYLLYVADPNSYIFSIPSVFHPGV